ncbi:MAG TPA: type IV toxin-antitoxin system AbiEi family antitoxin domain-containing protein, partial [Microthrixaceae bacterium]|nr:type IV toxin-antitoxin system AbiEi family antitoxin domain-containing protein [Microthrixaceae bacterium]
MDALSRIAAGRYGVVTIGEAEKCGVTRAQVRTLIRQGQWMRPRSGILVSSSAAASWMQQCAIASMASRGILSCRTAGFIHGLDGISDPPIEVTIPSSQNRPAGPWVIHRADNLVAADTVKVKGLHVTSLARTLVDLGSVA